MPTPESLAGRGGRRLDRRFRFLPALGLAVLVVVSWAVRFTQQGSEVAMDLLVYFFPMYEQAYGRLASGTLPLWNPYQLCGLPWLGVLELGFFYPAHLLYLVLTPPHALAVSQVAHLVLIALATAAFARRAGVGRAGALVAAALFTLTGRIPYTLVIPDSFEALAWLPVGCLAVLDLAAGRWRRGAALLALATAASLLAGYPQSTVYVLYLWASLLAALLVARWPGGERAGGAVLAFTGAAGLGVLAAAVQLVPAAELARVGTRTTEALSGPGRLAGMTPAGFMLFDGAIKGRGFSYGVVALAVLPAIVTHARCRTLGVWGLVVGLITAAFSIGASQQPVFRLVMMLPLVNWFRGPDRALVVADFALAMAAAVGVDALTQRRDPDVAPARRRVPAAVGAAVLGLALVGELVHRGWAPHATVVQLAVPATALCVLLAAQVRWPRAAGTLGALVALLVVAEISANPIYPVLPPYDYDMQRRYGAAATQYGAIAAQAGHERVWLVSAGPLPMFALKQATRYRLRTISDYEVSSLRRQADYFTWLSEGRRQTTLFPFVFMGDVRPLPVPPAATPLPERRGLLDGAAVRFVVAPKIPLPALKLIGQLAPELGFTSHSLQGIDLYSNPRAAPRAFVTYRTRPAPGVEALLAEMSRPGFDPVTESYVEGAPILGDEKTPRGAPARFVVDEETAVEVEAVLTRPGLVVLADSFYPGWHATVDGAEAAIFATNHLFRGVPVPAGTHRVRFEYRPRSLWLGATTSLLALGVIAALACRRQRIVEAT